MTAQNDALKYLELINVIFVVLHADQTVQKVNKKTCEALGYSEPDIIGSDWFEKFIPSGSRAHIRLLFQTFMDQRIASPLSCEHPVLASNGKEKRIAWQFTLLRDEMGKSCAMACAGIEITAYGNTDPRLQSSEEKFNAIFDYADLGIAMLDYKGYMIRANPTFQRLLSFKDDSLTNLAIEKLFRSEEAASISLIRDEIFQGRRKLFKAEASLQRADGSSLQADLTFSPVHDQAGKVQHIMIMVNDLTPRKKAEAALRRSEDRYRRFFNDDLTGDYLATVDGRIIVCNMAFCRIFGFPNIEEAKQSSIIKLFTDPQQLLSLLAEIQKIRRLDNYELKLQSCQGEPRYLIANIVGLFDARNQLTGIRGYLFDISPYKKIESQFMQAQKLGAIGRLAGGVAHDFNNLLSVINGYSQLALEKISESDPLRVQVEMIFKSGQRAEALTRQLLAFSRRQMLQPKIMDLNEQICDLEKLLNRVIGEDIQLVVRIHPALARIKADPSQMEQVIMNLALNARDAMPEGGVLTIETNHITLSDHYIRHHPTMQPGSYVMLAVSDTGTGMSSEVQARIFEPFFTTKPEGQGTDLGLSTVYGIVKQYGGFTWVYSEVGKGATFKIYLPVAESHPVALKSTIAEDASLEGSETILIAEDDGNVRVMVESLLSEQGYSVLTAQNGDEALKIAARHPSTIHLMITDVMMPEMNGNDLARQLSNARPEMKVLYVSGYTDDAITYHHLLDSDAHFLQKPFDTDELVLRIRQMLDA
jgi:PAS domain S-box-containing protein